MLDPLLNLCEAAVTSAAPPAVEETTDPSPAQVSLNSDATHLDVQDALTPVAVTVTPSLPLTPDSHFQVDLLLYFTSCFNFYLKCIDCFFSFFLFSSSSRVRTLRTRVCGNR